METIYLITGNNNKLASAKKCIQDLELKFNIQILNIESPEIQSFDNKEIVGFSAKYMAEKFQKIVLLSDVGYFIHGLNNFPGPYIKWMNQWFTTDQILQLMEGKEDRSFTIKEAVAFCRPGEEPIVFEKNIEGTIDHKASGSGSVMDQIGIIQGQSITVGAMDEQSKLLMRAENNPITAFLQRYQSQFSSE